MENKFGISEAFLLDALNKLTINLPFKEIDSIISPKLKEDLSDRIWLLSENLESNQRVEDLNIFFSFKMFVGNFNVFEFGSHINF